MKVRFTAEANNHLQQIHAYIATDSPQNAARMLDRIIRRAESLNAQAHRGRRVPEYRHPAIREIPEHPYRIIYRITDREIQILTIMHSRQLLPDDLAGLR